ncbi:MAG: 4Fe-4S binding protein [Pseudomonadota bacterium]
MPTLICDCNKTMPLKEDLLGTALGEPLKLHSTLCRREAGDFQQAIRGSADVIVACTQEKNLFAELAGQTEGAVAPIRFVNIRETGGWSRDAREATPKIAALLAAARLPEAEPVATVTYKSSGRLLVIGPLPQSEQALALLGDGLQPTLFTLGGAGEQQRRHPVIGGRIGRLTGWLGAFTLDWMQDNPIDLDLCTRCNACVSVCPEGAIGLDYQIDMARCTGHRACVKACDAAGAIDFNRVPQQGSDSFDLVLDLRAEPAFGQHAPPQGYFHLPRLPGAQGWSTAEVLALGRLRELVGEFEKPKFFAYKQKICAHSRNEQIGCTACIDVCSANAIRSDASRKGKPGGATLAGIIVEPHLCVGCGACTTVCPSGAISYATPRPDQQGKRIRTLLTTYQRAGGKDAALLIHSQAAGTKLIDALGRAARTDKAVRGVPARVLPLDVWHTASTGIDLWLSAIAFGAAQVWVLMTDEEAPEYRSAVAAQMQVAQAILAGMGLTGEHLALVEARDAQALDAALRAAPAQVVKQAATFTVQADKRATLDLAIEHLLQHASAAPESIALPAGASPFGNLIVNADRCTMCLSCVSACPEAALADNPDKPQLRFIEKNCVQCGLCASTCPEDAITLEPRLWLLDAGKARKQARVLNEVEPYRCIRCSKPFGTLKAIELMVGKLGAHPMFQGAGADRLRMCGDCRVIDIHTNPNEVRITEL